MLHCRPQRCFPAALSTPGKSRTPSLQPGSMPSSLVTKPGKPSASPREDFMDKTLPRCFHPPGRGCCSPCCAVTLPCPGSSIPSQQHPQPAGPGSPRQSSSQLEGISLSTQSLQLLLWQNLSQLLDILPASDSMSPIHLHHLPESPATSSAPAKAGIWAGTPEEVILCGVHVWHPTAAYLLASPSCQLPVHRVTLGQRAWVPCHPGHDQLHPSTQDHETQG